MSEAGGTPALPGSDLTPRDQRSYTWTVRAHEEIDTTAAREEHPHPPPARPPDETIRLLRNNWRAEMDGARVYRELAEAERDGKRKAILTRIAEAEERHAGRWEKKLAERGAAPPPPARARRPPPH